MHVTVFAMLQYYGIFKGNQMLLLNADQLETHLLCLVHFWEADNNQITHRQEKTPISTYSHNSVMSVSAAT